jgi:hypothetical protein
MYARQIPPALERPKQLASASQQRTTVRFVSGGCYIDTGNTISP